MGGNRQLKVAWFRCVSPLQSQTPKDALMLNLFIPIKSVHMSRKVWSLVTSAWSGLWNKASNVVSFPCMPLSPSWCSRMHQPIRTRHKTQYHVLHCILYFKNCLVFASLFDLFIINPNTDVSRLSALLQALLFVLQSVAKIMLVSK